MSDREDYRDPERIPTADLSICPDHQDPEPGRTLLYVYSVGGRHCELVFAANPKGTEEIQRRTLAEFQFGYGAEIDNDALDY